MGIFNRRFRSKIVRGMKGKRKAEDDVCGARKISTWTEEYLKPGAFRKIHDKITEKTKDGEVPFSYYAFVADVILPSTYSKGWFPKALKFAQQKLDLSYCNEVISRLESTDWDAEKGKFEVYPDGGRRDTVTFMKGLEDLFAITPTLHSLQQSDALERVFTIAKTMHMSSPRLFMMALSHVVTGLLPIGFLVRFDDLEEYLCPVKLFLLCYATRVLQTRFPFNCIPVQEFILKRAESKLQEKTLREYVKEQLEVGFGNMKGEYLFEMMSQEKNR